MLTKSKTVYKIGKNIGGEIVNTFINAGNVKFLVYKVFFYGQKEINCQLHGSGVLLRHKESLQFS